MHPEKKPRLIDIEDLDHIDPLKGRTVSGLNNPFNLAVRGALVNRRKTNRFLPWRVSSTEVGGVPVSQGDLCQFLDPDTNEWVLEKFLGEWWWEKTNSTAGATVIAREVRKKIDEEIVSSQKQFGYHWRPELIAEKYSVSIVYVHRRGREVRKEFTPEKSATYRSSSETYRRLTVEEEEEVKNEIREQLKLRERNYGVSRIAEMFDISSGIVKKLARQVRNEGSSL